MPATPSLRSENNTSSPYGVSISEYIVSALRAERSEAPVLRFEGLQYTDADIADFEMRLGKIYKREFGEAVLDLDTRALTVYLGSRVRHHIAGEVYLAMGHIMFEEIERWIRYIPGRECTGIFSAYWGWTLAQSTSLICWRYLRLFLQGGSKGAYDNWRYPMQAPRRHQPTAGPTMDMTQRLARVEEICMRFREALDDESWLGSGTLAMQNFRSLIMEYLVKISKKARILELKQRHLKITVLTSNTPYPSRKIRRICACTSQKTQRKQDQYVVSKEDQYAIFKLWK
ncbi:hypothetical protein Tco_0714114 [Tanacetum coccineum]